MAFQLPESLEGLSLEELDALAASAREELTELGISTESSDDDIAAAEVLVDALDAVATQRVAAETTAAERQGRLDRIGAAAAQPEPTPEPEATEPEPEAEATPPAEPEATPTEPEAQPEAESEQPEGELVTASNTTPVQRAAANRVPVDIAPPKPRLTLTAAANVPGLSEDSKLEGMDDIVDAIVRRVKAMPKHNLATKDGGVYQRFSTVVMERDPGDPELIQGNTGNDWDLVERAGNEKRLPGGSLVAAAIDQNWCSPSETLYELCELETVEGMVDVPEFTVRRGGIRYTKGPKWDDVYGDPSRGFTLTNNQQGHTNPGLGHEGEELDLNDMGAMAGVGSDGTAITAADPASQSKKPCIMVDCYPWFEERLDADGLCVKSPILLETTYPELIRRFTEMVLIAHRHDLNRRRLDRMRAAAVANGGLATVAAFGDSAAGTGGVPAAGPTNGRAIFNLAALEFYMMSLRHKYRLALTATIEVVAPAWLKEIIRMDLALENYRSNRNVTDAEINAWWSARNARVQWVYDWQELGESATNAHAPTFPGDGSPSGGTYTEAPESVELLMYPAGTWSAGVSDVISLDNVYDAASLEDNVFTALFMEEAELMVQRCSETIGVTVPLCISGRGVLDSLADCLVAA